MLTFGRNEWIDWSAPLGHPASSQFGPFLIDVGKRVTLRRDGEPVPLTPKAFDVLRGLARETWSALVSPKDELLRKVWPETFVERNRIWPTTSLRFGKRLVIRPITAAISKPYKRKATGSRRASARRSRPRSAQPASEFRTGPGPSLFTGETRDGEVTILPFRKGAVQSQVALELQAEPYSPAVESLAVPDAAPRLTLPFRRPWVWSAAVALLAAAGLYVVQSVQSRWNSPDATPPRAIPLTALPGVVRSPSLSPDGTFVVFSWNGPRKTNPDFFVKSSKSALPLVPTS